MPAVENLQETLTPSHLIPDIPESPEALKEDVEKAISAKDKITKLKEDHDPKLQREYSFTLNWEDGRGKVWDGEFTNKILTIRERQQAGVMCSRLNGGLPAGSLDILTDSNNMILSHLTFSLTKKPEWANNLFDLLDVALLQAIYEEVASHEARFFGREGTQI